MWQLCGNAGPVAELSAMSEGAVGVDRSTAVEIDLTSKRLPRRASVGLKIGCVLQRAAACVVCAVVTDVGGVCVVAAIILCRLCHPLL